MQRISNMSKSFILLCDATLFSCSSFAASYEKVVTTGQGETLDQAIDVGLRRAVEQISGVSIESSRSSLLMSASDGKTKQLVDSMADGTATYSRGDVKYKILSEKCSNDGCKVRLEVKVKVDPRDKIKDLNANRRTIAVGHFSGPKGTTIGKNVEELLVQDRKFKVLFDRRDPALQYYVTGKVITAKANKRVVDSSHTVELTGKSIKEQNEAIVSQVQAMNINNKTGIKYQQVMKDISEAGNATALTIGKFPGGVAKAAFAARKLGLSLSQVAKISENQLDFEQSIANEMEAELLLGKNLELDALRAASLRGDQAAVAAEIAKIQEQAGDFSEMNVIQQNALAKAMGMSREELADSLVKQKALNDLGIDQGKNVDAQLKQKIKNALAIEDETKRAEALAKIEEVSGAKELIRQQENKSLQEKQAKAMDDMTEAMTTFSTSLDPIGKVFSKISEYAGEIVIAMTALGGLSMFGKFRGLAKTFKGLTSSAKGVMNTLKGGGAAAKAGQKGVGAVMKGSGKKVFGAAATSAVKAGTASVSKTAAKVGAKSLGKSLLKKIPIIGALAGVGFALSRAAKGDWTGAALELASGAAGTIPGLGTAASVAIDAGLAARDISQAKSRSQEVPLSDFTLKPLDKDTITMAGGTKLGGNVEALLEELISIVKTGGDVYLDGSKVGSTLALSARLSN